MTNIGEAYDAGKKAGRDYERERIIKWIEENRTGTELAEGVMMYRDRFRSEDIIAFIKGELDESESD
jgi:hypothetical protein